jgi:hypothetical protein
MVRKVMRFAWQQNEAGDIFYYPSDTKDMVWVWPPECIYWNPDKYVSQWKALVEYVAKHCRDKEQWMSVGYYIAYPNIKAIEELAMELGDNG